MKQKGFTLLEILLVMAILAICAGFAASMYRNYGQNIGLESAGKNIVYDLRWMREKASGGEDRRNWGIHFVNNASDYYELFSSPTDYSDAGKTILNSVSLPGTIRFSVPAENESLDVVFAKISGNTTANSITIGLENYSFTINITPSGAIDGGM